MKKKKKFKKRKEKESREHHKRRGQKVLLKGEGSRDTSKEKAALITQKGAQP